MKGITLERPPDKAKILALPPQIFAGFLLAGLALSQALQTPWLWGWASSGLGWVPLALAMLIAGFAARAMKMHGTAIDPRSATSAIVATGPFRFSRNPLYLSLTLLNMSAACFADSLLMLLRTVPFMVTIHQGVILPEEFYLEQKFGDEYRRYKNRVRRWL